MITSNRQFGIEIEFLCSHENVLHKILHEGIRVASDGSLRPHVGGEYISPPLKGEEGANTIAEACRILKSNGVDVENPATSMHLHLDGNRDSREVEVSRKKINKKGKQIAVSRSLLRDRDIDTVTNSILATGTSGFYTNTKEFNDVTYFSRAPLTREPRMNYVYFLIEEHDRIKWLKNMLYFYTQYSGVISSLVSHSRSIGNMYCQQLSDSFTLQEIEGIKNEDDFIRVWYKGEGIGGRYCNSRYHNVNFHSYFDRHGTVEIRSHGATIDPNKILLWVKLHQYIADKLEKCELEDIKIDISPDKETPDNAYLEFIKFLEDEPVLVEYVKRLLGYFSGITINNNKVIRK